MFPLGQEREAAHRMSRGDLGCSPHSKEHQQAAPRGSCPPPRVLLHLRWVVSDCPSAGGAG